MTQKSFFPNTDEDHEIFEEATHHDSEPPYNFLTAREVSEKFFNNKVTYKKVLELTKKGILPAEKVCKNYIYMEDAIKEWANANFRTPAWVKTKKKVN